MSAFGVKQTFGSAAAMSANGPKADISFDRPSVQVAPFQALVRLATMLPLWLGES